MCMQLSSIFIEVLVHRVSRSDKPAMPRSLTELFLGFHVRMHIQVVIARELRSFIEKLFSI